MKIHSIALCLIPIAGTIFLTSCDSSSVDVTAAAEQTSPTPADVSIFLQRTEQELDELFHRAALINWDYYTNITDENEARVAEVDAEVTRKLVDLANATKQYQEVQVTATERRMLDVMSRGITFLRPQPREPLND